MKETHLEHFVIKDNDGLIYHVTMPDEPVKLQTAVLVDNQEEVKKRIYDADPSRNTGVNTYFKAGEIYALKCSVERKQYCASDVCDTDGQCEHCRDPKTLAHVTFSQPVEEKDPNHFKKLFEKSSLFKPKSEPVEEQKETQAFDKLVDEMDSKKVKVTFGLQPDHITAIETEFKRWRDMPPLKSFPDYKCQPEFMKAVWDGLGQKLGWCPFTLALYYFEHISKTRKNP